MVSITLKESCTALRGYQLADFIETWDRYLPPSHEDLLATIAKGNPTTSTESTSFTKSKSSTAEGSGHKKTTFAPTKSRLVSMSQLLITVKYPDVGS